MSLVCLECHYDLVRRKVPYQKTFERGAWNAMVDEETGVEPGAAAKLSAAD
ncbi:MAG: hypothetical protein WBG92_12735 [Thiohalocapsa sp.]